MQTLRWKVTGEKRDRALARVAKHLLNYPENWGQRMDDVIVRHVLGERKLEYSWGAAQQKWYDQRDRVRDIDDKFHDDVSLVLLRAVEKALRERIEKRRAKEAAKTKQ